MKNFILSFLIGLITSGSSFIYAREAKSYRVLFLGNSVFYSKGGLYQTFEGFCETAGLDFKAVSQWNEPENPHGVEFLNFGRIPLNLPEIAATKEIHSLIRSGDFDYVILEGRRTGFLLPEWVGLPENRGKSIPYQENAAALGKLHRTIVESGAQTVFYLHPGLHALPDIKHPVAQIYQRLHADLENMEIGGKRHKVIFVPAGLLWLDATRRYGVDNWYADYGHGNSLARYSSACMLYTYITGNDPRENTFRELPRNWNVSPEATAEYASEEDASWIKKQVWLYYSTRPQ
jgi:hypothetical protein